MTSRGGDSTKTNLLGRYIIFVGTQGFDANHVPVTGQLVHNAVVRVSDNFPVLTVGGIEWVGVRSWKHQMLFTRGLQFAQTLPPHGA